MKLLAVLLIGLPILIAWTDTSDSVKRNIFMDTRDSMMYHYVELDGLNWFQENLRYKTAQSLCVSKEANLCATCGEFYLLEEARTACPAGWRLPTVKEVKKLLKKERRGKFNIKDSLAIKLCGRIDNKKIAKIGEQNTYWLDAEEHDGAIEHWHLFHDENELHTHNVVNAQRQFPIRCVCERTTK